MPDGGDSFLPRIQSVFYAVFDVKHGPKIVYQVPEDLIASSSGLSASSADIRCPSAQRALFNFDDVHKYVIPPSALCGRLVICSTQNHRIIGFPVALKGRHYERNFFRYNICFVFDRGADLSCYEPIVRKVSRVMTAVEEESRLLSMPSKSYPIHAILEQLYEDLNSYAETSISVDKFNSIELKIFPFYPNPPPVQDWMVPLALINLAKRTEDNWDLTMVKVCKFIDGTNHVSRIAYLADCDIALTRQAISHLLYYQVIMTIDIFQWSNMYTLRKSIQWLADEIHVKEECGPYVTKQGHSIPDWPKLLHLYSRMKPGKTMFEWKEEFEAEKLGIDIRRFTSFGVIKGFLRRVHRWPVYLPPERSPPHKSQATAAFTSINATFDMNYQYARKRGHSLSNVPLRFPFTAAQGSMSSETNPNTMYRTTRPQTAGASTVAFPSPEQSVHGPSSSDPSHYAHTPLPPTSASTISSARRARRASAAEKILEQLRNRDKTAAAAAAAQQSGMGGYASPRNSWIPFQHRDSHQLSSGGGGHNTSGSITPTHTAGGTGGFRRPERRQSLNNAAPPPSPIQSKATLTTPSRPRISRSPSAQQLNQTQGQGSQSMQVRSVLGGGLEYPEKLIPLLDGEHHTDELCTKFEVGWPLLERWLELIGGGEIGSEEGRVVVIHR
ncbi:hypothetical protein AN958_08693 [Leucoagaricus sp. SymC.cos]|nr:hypothetical protein AN958_08693 [Leucoagaricus sp. SymC.cos]